MTVKELIEDYKRRINTVNNMLNEITVIKTEEQKDKIERLRIKRGCFNTFISELQKIKNYDN